MAASVEELLAEVPDIADHEARRLVLLAAGKSREWLIGAPSVDATAVARFRRLAARRRAGEPLQYLEGTVEFGPLELLIDSRALIPRPETERLWELAVAECADAPAVVVDLCTGSGNLALACKHAFPRAAVVGGDISPASIALARSNASHVGLDVAFVEGDLFEPLPDHLRGRIDLLVSNPPYVSEPEVADLPVEVKGHEPMQALVAGPAGTEVLARIAEDAIEWMAPQGVIACEIGESQGDAVLEMFAAFSPRLERDLAGRPRYVIGRTRSAIEHAPQQRRVH